MIEASRSASQRAAQSLDWIVRANLDLISIGLDHLTLARAALYESMLRGAPPPARI